MLAMGVTTSLLLAFLAVENTRSQAQGAPEADTRINSLIAAALQRAVITEKYVPDYELLGDKQSISLLDSTSTGKKITEVALPDSETIKFILSSEADLQRRANEQGSFVYLHVGKVQLTGDSAIIWIGTAWALQQPPVPGLVYLSGGAYELKYTWREGRWIFDRILDVSVS